MNNSTAPRRSTALWVILGAILLLVTLASAAVLLVVFYLVPVRVESSDLSGPQPASARAVLPDEFAERNGIQVLMLGVTADGGLIDMRFRVTDAAKATFLLEEANRPKLIAEDSGTVLTRHVRPEYRALESGRTYYLLFANSQGAISPGDLVAVELGGLRVEHLTAR